MPGVGQTIFQAAQGIVAQEQAHQRLLQQQQAFEAQLKQAERTFSLREREFRAKEGALAAEQERWEAEAAKRDLAFEAQKVQLSIAQESLKRAPFTARKAEAEAKKAELELIIPPTDGGKTSNQRDNFYMATLGKVNRDREIDEVTAAAVAEGAPEFKGWTVKDLQDDIAGARSIQMSGRALMPDQRRKKELAEKVLARAQTELATPETEDEFRMRSAKVLGVDMTDPEQRAWHAGVTMRPKFARPHEAQIFGPEYIDPTKEASSAFADAKRDMDPAWFAEQFGSKAMRGGEYNKNWTRVFSAWVMDNSKGLTAEDRKRNATKFVTEFMNKVEGR